MAEPYGVIGPLRYQLAIGQQRYLAHRRLWRRSIAGCAGEGIADSGHMHRSKRAVARCQIELPRSNIESQQTVVFWQLGETKQLQGIQV